MSDLAAAVAKVQAALPRIGRTQKGQVGTRDYRYADYESIMTKVRPLLREHGLIWSCWPDWEDGRFILRWRLMLRGGSGEDDWEGLWPLPEGNPQQQGSAITYAKRYAIVAVLDIPVAGEDDDASQASQDAPSAPQRTRAKVPGPDHERLREGTERGRVEGAERRTTPDPVDSWADRGPTPDHPARPRAATRGQIGYLQEAFKARGITDRDVRLGMASSVIGRKIGSFTDLTIPEANKLARSMEGASDD